MINHLNGRLDTAIRNNPTTFTRWDGKPFKRGVGVSASELWQCARRMGFSRANTDYDAGFKQGHGYFERGHAVEDRMVYRLRQALKGTGWVLEDAGADQKTLVWKNVSATPDGLLRRRRHPLGDPLCISTGQGDYMLKDDAILEIKSMDPRANMDTVKEAHAAQARLQIELYRVLDIAQPTGAVLLYVDASDYARRRWHWVPREDDFLEKAMRRAQMIIDAPTPMSLQAEGIWDGTCNYCPYQKTCGDAVLRYVPLDEVALLDEDAREMRLLIAERGSAMAAIKRLKVDQAHDEEDIRSLLRKAGTNRARVGTTTISYLKRGAPKILDKVLLTEELGDLENFYKTGKASARLTIKEDG